MAQQPVGAYEASWGEYGADEWADALVASMKLGGVDNLFFVSGSEIAFYQEAVTAQPGDHLWAGIQRWLWQKTELGKALMAPRGI